MGVGISRKSMVGFEVISKIHIRFEKVSKLTIDFLEMSTPMGESLCHLARLDVNLHLMLCHSVFARADMSRI